MTPVHPLAADGAVELALLERNGFVESRHLGAAVVIDAAGRVLRELGDTSAAVYPRSSLKPVQATAVRRSGVVLDAVATALSAASHIGTQEHQAVAARMLDDAGLSEQDLRCPDSWPTDPASARAATAPSRLAHNCSGKHAGFLTACVRNGWDPAGYLDPGHPLQRTVLDTLESLAEERIEQVGVDGCGAPVPALPLAALARAIGATALDPDGSAIATAMVQEAWAVDGVGRPTTSALHHGRLLAKAGAEGVFVASTVDGVAVAVKIIDGGGRASVLVGLSLLAGVGALDPGVVAAVDEETTEPVTGGDAVVGRLRVADALR